MTAVLLACAIITVGVMIYVFYLPGKLYLGPKKTRLAYLRERKEVIYDNLRDVNFEYKAGKFPEADYQTIKSSLEEEAAAVLAEIAHLESEEDAANRDALSPRMSKGVRT